jgi:hypothetical protein
VLIKTSVEHVNEQQLQDVVIKIGHEIEDATLSLLIEASEIEKVRFTRKANSPKYAAHPYYINKYDELTRSIEGYQQRLDGLRNRNLDIDFAKNVHGYDDFVKRKYDQFIQGTRIVKSKTMDSISEYSLNFNMLLDGLINLYPCLYRMNETTRYPLMDFGYRNLYYLDRGNANNSLIMMANSLRKNYSWVLQNRHLLGEENIHDC